MHDSHLQGTHGIVKEKQAKKIAEEVDSGYELNQRKGIMGYLFGNMSLNDTLI